MKAESTILCGLFVVQWFDFPTGNRAYGGGGWSRNAKHRPLPEPYQQVVKRIELRGKSAIVNGHRRLKCNIYDVAGKTWIRSDYQDLKAEFQFHQQLATDLRSMVGREPVKIRDQRLIQLK